MFYAGNVQLGGPQRDKTGKWYISEEEYPHALYPPFINAGAYVLSNLAVRKFYYASYFVKRFRFDDVYIGFIAWKLGTKCLNLHNFCFDKSASFNSYVLNIPTGLRNILLYKFPIYSCYIVSKRIVM